jgi:hypothetical protein
MEQANVKMSYLEFKVSHKPKEGEEFLILGSVSELGEWKEERALKLTNTERHPSIFRVSITVPEKTYFEYKYVIKHIKEEGKVEYTYELSRNRRITAKGYKLLVDDGHFCHPTEALEEFSSQWIGKSNDIKLTLGYPIPTGFESFNLFKDKTKINKNRYPPFPLQKK